MHGIITTLAALAMAAGAAHADQGMIVNAYHGNQRVAGASVSVVRCGATTNPAHCTAYASGSTDGSGALTLAAASGDYYVKVAKFFANANQRGCQAIKVYPGQYASISIDLSKGCFY